MTVKMAPGAAPVSVRLSVDGIVDWAYLVASPGHAYKGQGTSREARDLPLGLPLDLHLDPVEWTVHLANLTGVGVDYAVVVEFRQAGAVIGTWRKAGRVKSADEVILDDNRAVLYVGKAA